MGDRDRDRKYVIHNTISYARETIVISAITHMGLKAVHETMLSDLLPKVEKWILQT